ncbi:peptidoglycan DD-metalloendopeptidase family protein [uncultured Endozoicomonas sp.]|uniref:peptidoglycan DD-metalloendopeptidase family protein n=1 Tax=uncultured Endozoicomonas sp. TaxID=432652 RepID=UPI00263A0DEF|nr:peptidoglycan DD-metalloendopeptidase family protein [uncultured Endozoicomonas sp.]
MFIFIIIPIIDNFLQKSDEVGGVDKVLSLWKAAQIKMSDCSKKMLFLLFTGAVTLFVAGCSHDPSRVVVKELRSPPKVTSGSHRVVTGETLYSIAWSYGRDFKELARNNGIRSPYTIYPGQRINLSARKYYPLVTAKSTPPKKKPIRPSVVKPVNKPTPVSPPRKSPTAAFNGWQWPAKGKVVAAYSTRSPVNKGIDISGKLGEPVKAAANGEVVYAGSDLSGYGRLIILKHNSSYLSAYAHNKDLFVSEGDSVKAGQKIAEIGSTGTTEPKLHFEIRRDGKPVDPMGFLPKR